MRILIGYNGSESAAETLADLERAGLPDETDMALVTVTEPHGPTGTADVVGIKALEAVSWIREHYPLWKVTAESVSGSPAREILSMARDIGSDLIVIGASGDRQIHAGNSATVAQTIVAEAVCSVRVVRRTKDARPHMTRIVVGFDGTRGSELAVDSIASRRWPEGSEVLVVSAADFGILNSIGRFVPQMNDSVVEAKIVQQWGETLAESAIAKLTAAGIKAFLNVEIGHARDVIIGTSRGWHANSIVVGSHRSGNAFHQALLGSVSSAVASAAHCSVEVVRSKHAG